MSATALSVKDSTRTALITPCKVLYTIATIVTLILVQYVDRHTNMFFFLNMGEEFAHVENKLIILRKNEVKAVFVTIAVLLLKNVKNIEF